MNYFSPTGDGMTNNGLNKAKSGDNQDNNHFNQIYVMDQNQKEKLKIDKNKMSKVSFYSNSSHSNTFYNQNKKLNAVDPQEIGDRLYKNAFQIKKKIEKMRIDDEQKRKRSRTPEISPGARKIIRDPKKFAERLYPSHMVKSKNSANNNTKTPPINQQEVQIINTVMDVGFIKNLENNTDFDPNAINHSQNQDDKFEIKNQFEEEENLNDYENHLNPNDKSGMVSDDDSSINKIYRKNKDKSDFYNFDHKPKLNKNSLKIAEQLQPAKERLVSKKKRSKSRSRSRTPVKNKNPAYHFTYLTDDELRKELGIEE